MKRMISILLGVLLVLSLAVPAMAATSSVTYTGHNLFGFAPGSEFTDTDLFDNFKGVMPGDVLTETVTVKNTASCCDFVKIYMHAEIHNASNPLSPKVEEQETVVSMEDFLSRLSMTVKQGTKTLFDASPDELDGLEKKVLLGTFRRNKGTTLDVQLKVPAELGNEYAYRVGEVDWVFTVEEYDDDAPDTPKTGDESHAVLYLLLMAVSGFGAILLLPGFRRKKHTD